MSGQLFDATTFAPFPQLGDKATGAALVKVIGGGVGGGSAAGGLGTTLWIDSADDYFLRRDYVDPETSEVTVTWTTPAGVTATPVAPLRPSGNEESLHPVEKYFIATAAGTGYSIGDSIYQFTVLDTNANPVVVVAAGWVNVTTSLSIAAPDPGDLKDANTDILAKLAELIVEATATKTALQTTDPVAVRSMSLTDSATFTRPADAAPYLVGDIIANDTAFGSVAPMVLTVAAEGGGRGCIREVTIEKGGATAATIRAHFWTTTPTVDTAGDNGVFAGHTTKAGYIGSIDVELIAFADGARGVGIGERWFDLAGTDTDVFCLLETRTAFTPTTGSAYSVETTSWPAE